MTDYSSYSKEGLLQVLMDAGGLPEKVDDPENFKIAWNALQGIEEEPDEVIVVEDKAALIEPAGEVLIEGTVFEIPATPSPWSLIPPSQIDTDDKEGLIQLLFDLKNRHGLQYPEGLDEMSDDDLRVYLREVVTRDDIREREAELQDDDTLRNMAKAAFRRTNVNGKHLLIYPAVCDYLHLRFHTVTFHPPNIKTGPVIYVYDKKSGIHRPNSGDLEAVINQIYRACECQGSIVRDTREIMHLLASKNRHVSYPFNRQRGGDHGLIPVLNGVVKLNFEEMRVSLLPHDPEHMWTFTLPVRYDPEADPEYITEVLRAWIGEGTDGDGDLKEGVKKIETWRVLLQIPAQALLQFCMDKTYKRAYILVGEADAGKSSFITTFLPKVFGSGNVSSVSLQSIVSDRFASGNLENKMLNAFDDLSDKELGAVGPFKAYTGATMHDIERKHQGSYPGRIFCVHAFACNQLPKVPESCMYDAAFWDRWVIIRFPYSFDVDPVFQERLIQEENLNAFFILVLSMMMSIRRDRALPFDQSPGEVMALWLQKADPVAQFLEDTCNEVHHVNRFDQEKFYQAYLKWFDAQDPKLDPRKRIRSRNKFGEALMKYKFTIKKTSSMLDKRKCNVDIFEGKWMWNGGMGAMTPEVKRPEKRLDG